jgi:hypothetical protein
MNPERMQVLQMLAEGRISPEDADRLLEKLQAASARPAASGPVPPRASATAIDVIAVAPNGDAMLRPPLKFLRVLVTSAKEDQVNIRIPIALVRTGLKLATMIPEDARQRLKEKGVDLGSLSGLEGEELIEALRELRVDVDSGKGDMVRVFCE